MQRFCLFVLLHKGLKFLFILPSLVVFVFEALDMFPDLRSVLLSLLLFQTLPEFCLQCLFLMLPALNQSFLFLHRFLESFEVLVYLFDFLSSPFPPFVLVGEFVIKI